VRIGPAEADVLERALVELHQGSPFSKRSEYALDDEKGQQRTLFVARSRSKGVQDVRGLGHEIAPGLEWERFLGQEMALEKKMYFMRIITYRYDGRVLWFATSTRGC
jgi:hypothetical protein